jgi:cyanate permease
MGVLRDATGNYTAALALCLALDFIAAVIVLAGRSAK